MTILPYALAGGGLLAGYILRTLYMQGKRGSLELELKQMELAAKDEALKIIEDARHNAENREREIKMMVREKEHEAKTLEMRVQKREDMLDIRQEEINREADILKRQADEIRSIKENIKNVETRIMLELEHVSRMTTEEARDQLLSITAKHYEDDIAHRLQKLESGHQERFELRAREILTSAMQRLSTSPVHEHITSSIILENSDIKGKIIGNEGRNIKTFERMAGVELLVDESPESIVISAFDPVRRQIAKNALQALIADGRIQPAKIEEEIAKAQANINQTMTEKGEQAVYETGVLQLPPEVIQILGRLAYRTSYGQNVLQHSIEVVHIAAMLAEELGADVSVAKAGALVHDIGKALDHEVEGTHVNIGMRILEKFGVDKKIIDAMKSHHDEYPHESIESVIVQVADHISGGRPGARRDSVEQYVKRLADLEAITGKFKGVERSYALQAGREIRVFVTPEVVSDIEAKKLARDIAVSIEKELKYPGEIKVTLIRENRVIEYAR